MIPLEFVEIGGKLNTFGAGLEKFPAMTPTLKNENRKPKEIYGS